MKTNSVLRTLMVVMFTTVLSNSLIAQFIGTNSTNQDPPVEERKGGITTYTVAGPPEDEYTWQVVGGTIISPSGATGSGTVADPWVVPFTPGLTSIQVQWPADDNTITSLEGNVGVQQKVPSGTIICPSVIQLWDVTLWSNPTATITTTDLEICSGDATGGSVTVEFTGAPDFSFTYTITDLDGVESDPAVVTGITGSSATIDLPDNLVNTSTDYSDQTYVITLTQMNDGFTENGIIWNSTFTITVHPTVVTGPISSDRALSRR